MAKGIDTYLKEGFLLEQGRLYGIYRYTVFIIKGNNSAGGNKPAASHFADQWFLILFIIYTNYKN